jgi:hypothetical protein
MIVSAELGALDARSWAEVTLRRASVAMLWEDHRRAIGSSGERAYAQSETSGRCARIAERQMRTEALMLREQMITLLQTSVVFLLLTNTASLVAAVYALRRASKCAQSPQSSKSAIERNLDAMLRRAG